MKNCKLIKAPIAELGISKVDVKLSIADMYEAKHEIKPELEFDPNGGKWTEGGSAVREYDADLETEFDIIDAPKRTGYTFVCWKGSEYHPGDKYTVAEDHVFTAQWKKNGSDTPGGSDDADGKDSGKDTGNDPDKSGRGAKTGDAFDPMILLLLLIGSAGAMIAFSKKLRRAED